MPITANDVSPEEWRLRQELAACYRLFVRFGWTDLIFTHLTARLPDNPAHYLINPYGLLFTEITAGNLLKVTLDGEVLAGDYPYNDAGHAIHAAVLRARPDVNCVLHSHTRAGMTVSCMQDGLLPLSQQAGEIHHLVCYHDYDVASADDNHDECERLGRDMGQQWLMIMRNHGLLSAGRTIAEAFYHLYVLENACKVQVDVMASGANLVYPKAEALEKLAAYTGPHASGPTDTVTRCWQALIRQLDKQQPDYLD